MQTHLLIYSLAWILEKLFFDPVFLELDAKTRPDVCELQEKEGFV